MDGIVASVITIDFTLTFVVPTIDWSVNEVT